MATAQQTGIHAQFSGLQNPSAYSVGIAVAEWNDDITGMLSSGARQALLDAGIPEHQIRLYTVAGSYELPLASAYLLDSGCDAVVALGCLIKGDTPHFEYISEAVTQGIMRLNLDTHKPVIFGVLTTLTHQQALERASGSLGNKGYEAAVAALKMLKLKADLDQGR
jgi:6,7-dimethyl-8-ribityllumazine synthase